MGLETHVATRKDHRCDVCGKRIPIGARYFSRKEDSVVVHKEHTNCEIYTDEPLLVIGYNQNRQLGEVKYQEQL